MHAHGMDRRALLQRILLLAGTTAIPIGCTAPAESGTANFRFETAQFAALSAIADTLIPKGKTVGALDVGVPEKFEALMREWASHKWRDEIVSAIEVVDSLANKHEGRDFGALDAATRLALLTPMDAAALKKVERREADGEVGLELMMAPAYADPGYAKMRELIILLFYYSEPALMQELTYVHSPGRWDPSVPITPETRQTGGMGLF